MAFGGRSPLPAAALTKQANQISTNLHTGLAAGPEKGRGVDAILLQDDLMDGPQGAARRVCIVRAAAPTGSHSQCPRRDRGHVSKQQRAN